MFFSLFVLLWLSLHVQWSSGETINVVQSNMLTSATLMANTTYRVNSTLDMSGTIRGAQGTILLCALVEVCIRVPAGQTLQVLSLQLGFQGTQARTVFLTPHNARIELTNVTIAPSHSGFLVLGATGDFRATMRGVVARNVFLIAVNDTQGNSQIDLDDVSTTSNNAIVMNGGTSNGNGIFRVADCEFNGTGGTNTIIRAVNTSESVAVFREVTIDRTTFRSGFVELRARQAIRFTDVTMVGVVANVASGGET
jgi:hypothetical protein